MKKCLKKNKGLFAISIALGICFAIGNVIASKILQKVIDTSLEGNMNGFKQVLLFSTVYLFVLGVISFIYGFVNKKLTNRIFENYRQEVYSGVMRMSFSDFGKSNSAEYISALTNDMKMVEENYVIALLSIIQYLFIFIATIIMLISLSITVTVSLIISVLLMLMIPSLLGKKLKDKQNLVSTTLKTFTTQVKDILSGFEVIKTFNAFHHYKKIFDKVNGSVAETKLSADKLLVLNESISNILGALCQFVVIFVSAYLIIKGKLTAGTSIALIQLSGTFIMPIITILTNVPKIQGIEPVMKKLNEISEYGLNAIDKVKLVDFKTSIDIENLSFTYNGEKQVLKNIDLKIEKEKKYAVIGKSGCGKSTLTKIISGYYESFDGTIMFDGESIKNLDVGSSSNLISTIHQNVYMFDTTIKNNITLYDNYSDAEMERVLFTSGVGLFLNETSDGINSSVGENGNQLSGGQRQRIAVARALIKNTSVLVLDEGTSAIDKQTAYEIESKLLNVDSLTLITITHAMNPELLEKYDEIIFMDNGQISEKGTFQDLISQKGLFYDFYSLKAS